MTDHALFTCLTLHRATNKLRVIAVFAPFKYPSDQFLPAGFSPVFGLAMIRFGAFLPSVITLSGGKERRSAAIVAR